MNILQIKMNHVIYDIVDNNMYPDKEPVYKEVSDEFRFNYEPSDIDSSNNAIDSAISTIIKANEEFRSQAGKFGFECQSDSIELTTRREDETIITSINIDNTQDLTMFQNIYQFLKSSFYYI